ncbi:Ubiquitin-2 like Rad60 SUMO-like, putative [Leishmania donovani]|uniref:Ubiquitin-2 like Rad60 SUMO-like, putative n=1 Tax=Leishmania donovani TaxID=5661 RepID=A0A3Q8IB92_LEIDO|nr:Ubiquitin-2 like Rad60 SUMO-like, putative [Leishmania donovani]
MERVRIRYVLTGACPFTYSGRVVHDFVALKQPNGCDTTIEMVKAQFRSNWPADMKELAERISESGIRVLKAGRVLNDGDSLTRHLTASEREACLVSGDTKVGDTNDEMQKPSVLVHMVIQGNRAPPAENSKREKHKVSSTPEGGNSGEGHEVKKDSCCCVM